MTKSIMLALVALSMFGCAHSQAPAPATPEALPGHQAEAPPPRAEPATPTTPSTTISLQMPARPGWVQLPRSAGTPEGINGMFLNPSAHAIIMIAIEAPTASTARAAADTLRGQLGSGDAAWTCSRVTAWPDANSASFTVSRGTNRGRITVRRLHENPSVNVAFLGQWPAAGNPAMLADYNAMVSAATLQ